MRGRRGFNWRSFSALPKGEAQRALFAPSGTQGALGHAPGSFFSTIFRGFSTYAEEKGGFSDFLSIQIFTELLKTLRDRAFNFQKRNNERKSSKLIISSCFHNIEKNDIINFVSPKFKSAILLFLCRINSL